MKIVTEHINPPIPVRQFDWGAYLDGHEEDGMYGMGRTEEEAVKDLLENWGDTYCHGCNQQIFTEDCTVARQAHGESLLVCPCGSDNVERIQE